MPSRQMPLSAECEDYPSHELKAIAFIPGTVRVASADYEVGDTSGRFASRASQVWWACNASTMTVSGRE